MAEVRWPGEAVDPESKDLLPPIRALLEGINVLGSDADATEAAGAAAAFSGPSVGISIIESGATAVTKGWAAVVGAFGGAAALWTAASDFWDDEETPVRVAIIAAMGVIIFGCLLLIATILRSDLRARGAGAIAQYQTRAAIANTFLQLARQGEPPASSPSEGVDSQLLLAALGAYPETLKVFAKGSNTSLVKGIERLPDGELKIQTSEDWLEMDEVTGFTTQ